jgi:hypothetical protein
VHPPLRIVSSLTVSNIPIPDVGVEVEFTLSGMLFDNSLNISVSRDNHSHTKVVHAV